MPSQLTTLHKPQITQGTVVGFFTSVYHQVIFKLIPAVKHAVTNLKQKTEHVKQCQQKYDRACCLFQSMASHSVASCYVDLKHTHIYVRGKSWEVSSRWTEHLILLEKVWQFELCIYSIATEFMSQYNIWKISHFKLTWNSHSEAGTSSSVSVARIWGGKLFV